MISQQMRGKSNTLCCTKPPVVNREEGALTDIFCFISDNSSKINKSINKNKRLM